MKIHGTAKGGALSTKDFGVAFGGAAVTPFDDTDLKSYWKFDTNPTSGDISNVSEADASLGSGADLQVTGAIFDTTSPFDYGISLDGSDDYLVSGTSLSQFNFLHLTGAAYSINAWVLFPDPATSFGYIMNTNEVDDLKMGMVWKVDALPPNGALRIGTTTNGSNAAYLAGADLNFIPSLDTWYMITVTVDYSAGSGAASSQFRDGGNKSTTGTLAGSIPTGNAVGEMTFGARANILNRFTKIKYTEISVWDRVLTDDEIIELWNDGSGKAIY